jgi:hypothetical protein
MRRPTQYRAAVVLHPSSPPVASLLPARALKPTSSSFSWHSQLGDVSIALPRMQRARHGHRPRLPSPQGWRRLVGRRAGFSRPAAVANRLGSIQEGAVRERRGELRRRPASSPSSGAQTPLPWHPGSRLSNRCAAARSWVSSAPAGSSGPLTVVGVCRGEREHENQVLGPIEPCRSASVLFSKEKPPSTAGILHHRPQCRRNLRATRASTPVRSHLRPGHVWSIRTPKGDPPTIACEVCPPPDPRDEWHEGNLPEPGTFRYRGGTTCQMHPPRQGFRPPGSPGGSRPRLANWM